MSTFEYGYRYVGELPGNEVGPFGTERLARRRAAQPGRVLVRRQQGTEDAWKEAENDQAVSDLAGAQPERQVPDLRGHVG